MNKQENENDNQTIIEDLPVDDARQDEVKGGDWKSYGHILTGNP